MKAQDYLKAAKALRLDEWDESAHPRAENGQFGDGSGSGSRERPTWKPNPDGGYTHTFGATLKKDGKVWHLTYKGQTVKLPKKASFDHAERAMGEIDSR